jgi:hypothetical protein
MSLGVRSAWKEKAAVVSQTGLSLEGGCNWRSAGGRVVLLYTHVLGKAGKTDEGVQRVCRHIHYVSSGDVSADTS